MLLRETDKMRLASPSAEDFRYFVFIPLNVLDFETDSKKVSPIKNQLKNIFINLPWEEYFNRNSSKNLLIMLDGFNELPIVRRNIVAKEIIYNLPDTINCSIVLSSRYEDTLANNFKNAKTAVICELASDEIRQYLIDCQYAGNVDSDLENILKNPLMLTLFGNTAKYQHTREYRERRDLCRWISILSNDVNDSQILWNYLCCDIMKFNSLEKSYAEDVFLSWLALRFVFPRIAYFMQSKKDDPFHVNSNELKEQITLSINWINSNKSHIEIQHASWNSQRLF